MTGTTKSGFAFEVPESIRNDWRFVEALADMESEDGGAKLRGQASLPRLLLGKEGSKALFAHVRGEDGTIPTDRVLEEIADIIGQLAQDRAVKN